MIHNANGDKSIDRFDRRVDGVSTRELDTCLAAHRFAPVENFLDRLQRQVFTAYPQARVQTAVPPIAYTSDIALVAAMRLKSNGSSTMGIKNRSSTIACVSLIWYTAASSDVSDADQQFLWQR